LNILSTYFELLSGILAMKYGFELIQKFSGMREISKRTHHLAKYLYENLTILKYENGSKVVEIYASNHYSDSNTQGGIVNFNILQKDGKMFGFTEFKKIAIHCNLVVRVGCFCNIGSCQKYLGITDEDIEPSSIYSWSIQPLFLLHSKYEFE
jgi:molybdenum cofactor sulfurtransferase